MWMIPSRVFIKTDDKKCYWVFLFAEVMKRLLKGIESHHSHNLEENVWSEHDSVHIMGKRGNGDSKNVSTPSLQLITSLSKDLILVSSVLLGKVVNKVVSAGLFGNRGRNIRNLNVFKVQEAKFQLHSYQSVHIWFCELTCHLFSQKSIQAISPNAVLVNIKERKIV